MLVYFLPAIRPYTFALVAGGKLGKAPVPKVYSRNTFVIRSDPKSEPRK